MDKRDLGVTALAHSADSAKAGGTAHSKDKESFIHKRSRLRQELVKAGMTAYGLSKFNTRHLPSIIRDGEHVHGVIYGRHIEGPGFLGWMDRMIVATDHRVISFNHKPGYTDDDIFTYDVINGVDASTAGPFTAVTLETRSGKVTIRFVNKRCAEIFIKYIAKRRLEFFRTRTPRDLPKEETD
jgi:hypothetical protein